MWQSLLIPIYLTRFDDILSILRLINSLSPIVVRTTISPDRGIIQNNDFAVALGLTYSKLGTRSHLISDAMVTNYFRPKGNCCHYTFGGSPYRHANIRCISAE